MTVKFRRQTYLIFRFPQNTRVDLGNYSITSVDMGFWLLSLPFLPFLGVTMNTYVHATPESGRLLHSDSRKWYIDKSWIGLVRSGMEWNGNCCTTVDSLGYWPEGRLRLLKLKILRPVQWSLLIVVRVSRYQLFFQENSKGMEWKCLEYGIWNDWYAREALSKCTLPEPTL